MASKQSNNSMCVCFNALITFCLKTKNASIIIAIKNLLNIYLSV